MKPQHRKQGNREHVLYVPCAVCIVRTVYSTCKWDRIVRTVVQYVLWCHSAPPFFEVGSIQALKDAHEIRMYEWGIQDTRSKYTEVCEVSLTKNLRGKTNLDWKSLGKSWKRFSVTTCVLWGSGIASCALVDTRGACRHASGPCRVPNYRNSRHSRSIVQGTPYWIFYDDHRDVLRYLWP